METKLENITIFGNRVYVKPAPVKKQTETGIIIPDTVSSGIIMEKGVIENISIELDDKPAKKGMNIMYVLDGARKEKYAGVEYLMFPYENIIGEIKSYY